MAIKKETKAEGKMKHVRWALFAFNIIFWIFGVATMGVGIWILVENSNISALTDNLFRNGTILVIVSGVLITLVGFLGWFGSYQEHMGLLGVFCAALIAICIMEIAAGASAGAIRGEQIRKLQNSLYADITVKYGNASNPVISRALDDLQHRYRCCGANNYTDWNNSSWKQFKNFKPFPVPTSCCIPTEYVDGCGEDTNVRNETNPAGGIFTRGCRSQILVHIQSHTNAVIGIGVTVGIVQIFGIVFTTLLLDHYRHLQVEEKEEEAEAAATTEKEKEEKSSRKKKSDSKKAKETPAPESPPQDANTEPQPSNGSNLQSSTEKSNPPPSTEKEETPAPTLSTITVVPNQDAEAKKEVENNNHEVEGSTHIVQVESAHPDNEEVTHPVEVDSAHPVEVDSAHPVETPAPQEHHTNDTENQHDGNASF